MKKILAMLMSATLLLQTSPVFAARATLPISMNAIGTAKHENGQVIENYEVKMKYKTIESAMKDIADGVVKDKAGFTYSLDSTKPCKIYIQQNVTDPAYEEIISEKVIVSADPVESADAAEVLGSDITLHFKDIEIAVKTGKYMAQHAITFSGGLEVQSGASLTLGNTVHLSQHIINYTLGNNVVVAGELEFKGNMNRYSNVTFSDDATLMVQETGTASIGRVEMSGGAIEQPLITVAAGGTLNVSAPKGSTTGGKIEAAGTAVQNNGGTLNLGSGTIKSASNDSNLPTISSNGGNVILKVTQETSSQNPPTMTVEGAPAISVTGNASLTVEEGSISNTTGAPAVTVGKGATVVIPENSKAEIQSEGGTVAIDLEGGSKVQQGNNTITVASGKDDSASNYVDNYGNLVLQNGSDDGTVAPNTVIQPNGTTITGNETLPNVNDDGSVSIPTGGATITNPEGEKVEVGSGEMPTIVIGVKDQSGHVETSKTIDLNSGPLTLETVVFGHPIDLDKYTCNVTSDKSNVANATLNNDHKIVVTPVGVGEAVITATYTNNDTKASVTATFNVKVTTTSSGGGGGGGGSSSGGDSTSGTQFVKNAVYRAYNPNSGEHFYTPNYDEFKYITSIGWNDEGIACMTETKTNGHTLYRLYNPNSGLHHYTLDENEKNALVSLGWKDEDVAWYTSKNENDPAVYRLYNLNDGQHHYTMDVKERDALVKLGWTYEGVGYHTSPIKK